MLHKRVTDPARCGTQRGVGRERQEVGGEWGWFNEEGIRKKEMGEDTRKCIKITKCKCTGPENGKRDRNKGKE